MSGFESCSQRVGGLPWTLSQAFISAGNKVQCTFAIQSFHQNNSLFYFFIATVVFLIVICISDSHFCLNLFVFVLSMKHILFKRNSELPTETNTFLIYV